MNIILIHGNMVLGVIIKFGKTVTPMDVIHPYIFKHRCEKLVNKYKTVSLTSTVIVWITHRRVCCKQDTVTWLFKDCCSAEETKSSSQSNGHVIKYKCVIHDRAIRLESPSKLRQLVKSDIFHQRCLQWNDMSCCCCCSWDTDFLRVGFYTELQTSVLKA